MTESGSEPSGATSPVDEAEGNGRSLLASRLPGILRTLGAVVIAGGALVAAIWSFRNVIVCSTVKGPNLGELTETCRPLEATDPPALAAGVLLLIAVAILFDFQKVAFAGFELTRKVEQAEAAAASAKEADRSAQAAKAGATAAAASAGDARDGASAAAAEGKKAESEAQRAAREAAEANRSAQSAEAHARGANESARMTERIAKAMESRMTRPQDVERHPESADLKSRIKDLAADYVAIREASPGGSEKRSQDMTDVVAQMIALFSQAGPSASRFATEWLSEMDKAQAGLRLAAYAYLYTFPDKALTVPLVRSVLKDPKPFTEYWGWRAVRYQVEAGNTLDNNTIKSLERQLRVVGSHTDRGYEIGQILRRNAEATD